MSRYDVVVVGAGPCGASAALALARRGARVVLLERETLPRFKPCGGIVPRAVFRLLGQLDPELAEPAEQDLPLSTIRYSYRGEEESGSELPEGLSLSVERRHFDHRIVRAAERAGVEVRDGLAVGSLVESSEGVRLVTSTGARIQASFLVGADGGNSLVAARLGLRRGREPLAVASEVQLPGKGSPVGESLLDFGRVRNGYLGTVTKREFLTLGAYVLGRPPEGGLQPALLRFAESRGLPASAPAHTRSFPVYRPGRRLHTRRGVVAGDAAGLVDPLSGEGIRHAVRSGLLAAEHVARSLETGQPLEAYTDAVHRELGPELVLAGRLARVAYTFPRIAYTGMKRVPREASLVINGEMSYRQLLLRLANRIFRTTGQRVEVEGEPDQKV